MGRYGVWVLVLSTYSVLGYAQTGPDSRVRKLFYVAPGVFTLAPDVTLQVGAGGEWRIYRGLYGSADVGYLTVTDCLRCGIGLLSLNGSYFFHSREGRKKWTPFLTGGYSLGFREGIGHFGNFGGGVDFGIGDGYALRVEVRDHIAPVLRHEHYVAFRVGLSVR